MTHYYEHPGIYHWKLKMFGMRADPEDPEKHIRKEMCIEMGVVIILPAPQFDYILRDELGRGIMMIASNTCGFPGLELDKTFVPPAYYEFHDYTNGDVTSGFGEFVFGCRPGQNHNICFFSDPTRPWMVEYELDLVDCLARAKFVYMDRGYTITFADFSGCPEQGDTLPVPVK